MSGKREEIMSTWACQTNSNCWTNLKSTRPGCVGVVLQRGLTLTWGCSCQQRVEASQKSWHGRRVLSLSCHGQTKAQAAVLLCESRLHSATLFPGFPLPPINHVEPLCWSRFPVLLPHQWERSNLEMFSAVQGSGSSSGGPLIPIEWSSLGRRWRGAPEGWGPAALIIVLNERSLVEAVERNSQQSCNKTLIWCVYTHESYDIFSSKKKEVTLQNRPQMSF